jgi:hypothetical protein
VLVGCVNWRRRADAGQYLFVATNTRRATLFALRDAPCGHQETRRTAERTIRDSRVHISSQLETAPAGARNYSFFSPPTSLVHPHLQRRSALSELHNHSFRISALRAFKGPLVVTVLVGWFDLRKKHWHSAQRASSLSYRRRRIENDGLRHGTLPDWFRRERNWSLGHRRLQAVPRSVMLKGNS